MLTTTEHSSSYFGFFGNCCCISVNIYLQILSLSGIVVQSTVHDTRIQAFRQERISKTSGQPRVVDRFAVIIFYAEAFLASAVSLLPILLIANLNTVLISD